MKALNENPRAAVRGAVAARRLPQRGAVRKRENGWRELLPIEAHRERDCCLTKRCIRPYRQEPNPVQTEQVGRAG